MTVGGFVYKENNEMKELLSKLLGMILKALWEVLKQIITVGLCNLKKKAEEVEEKVEKKINKLEE